MTFALNWCRVDWLQLKESARVLKLKMCFKSCQWNSIPGFVAKRVEARLHFRLLFDALCTFGLVRFCHDVGSSFWPVRCLLETILVSRSQGWHIALCSSLRPCCQRDLDLLMFVLLGWTLVDLDWNLLGACRPWFVDVWSIWRPVWTTGVEILVDVEP